MTSRVVLRELRRSDAAALLGVAGAPAVVRHSWPAPSSLDAFDAYITSAWRERTDGKGACFAFVPRDHTEPAGMFELRALQPGFFRAELGLLLGPSWCETDAFDDALRLVCAFGFTTLGGHRIEIRSAVENTACNRALEKIGVEREAVLRAAFAHGGRFADEYLWAIVRGLDALGTQA